QKALSRCGQCAGDGADAGRQGRSYPGHPARLSMDATRSRETVTAFIVATSTELATVSGGDLSGAIAKAKRWGTETLATVRPRDKFSWSDAFWGGVAGLTVLAPQGHYLCGRKCTVIGTLAGLAVSYPVGRAHDWGAQQRAAQHKQ